MFFSFHPPLYANWIIGIGLQQDIIYRTARAVLYYRLPVNCGYPKAVFKITAIRKLIVASLGNRDRLHSPSTQRYFRPKTDYSGDMAWCNKVAGSMRGSSCSVYSSAATRKPVS